MTKTKDANFLQITTGAGIMFDKAVSAKMMAEGTGGPAVDVEAENGKLTALREKIKQLKPPGPESQPQMDTDQHR